MIPRAEIEARLKAIEAGQSHYSPDSFVAKDLRSLLDALAAAERERDEARTERKGTKEWRERAEAAESRAEALAWTVREWQETKALLISYPRWLDLSEAERYNYFKARDAVKAAEAALLALDVQESS